MGLITGIIIGAVGMFLYLFSAIKKQIYPEKYLKEEKKYEAANSKENEKNN